MPCRTQRVGLGGVDETDVVGHDQRGDVPAQCFVGRVAEQLGGALVPERDLVVQVGAHDRLAHAVQQHRLHAQLVRGLETSRDVFDGRTQQFAVLAMQSAQPGELLGAIDDEQVAVAVDVADIASAKPALAVDEICRDFRVVVIALHHLRAADPHLPEFPGLRLGPRHDVDDPAQCAGHRNAERAYLARLPRREVGQRHGFGEPVGLANAALEAILTGACDRLGQRCGHRRDLGQGRQVEVADAGVLGQRSNHRRHQIRAGDAMPFHRTQQPFELEVRET